MPISDWACATAGETRSIPPGGTPSSYRLGRSNNQTFASLKEGAKVSRLSFALSPFVLHLDTRALLVVRIVILGRLIWCMFRQITGAYAYHPH